MAIKTDAAKIRRWREERQWSQEHLAELAGIGLRTVQRIETGEPAARDTLLALAAAFNVDVSALGVDPHREAADIVRRKNAKARAGIRLSFGIHLASFVLGVVVFLGISWGMGAFVMKWPLIWWTVGVVAQAAAVAIVELATRFQAEARDAAA